METVKLKAKITIEFEYDCPSFLSYMVPEDKILENQARVAMDDIAVFIDCRHEEIVTNGTTTVEIEEVKP